ncbi:hypothetical protein [Tychonema sp. LEGE 07203]|uniref:hypothetical protein n=1 Tax=Tychonema sp. LEGE 07203 TaxID=1828671 RepID=UPI0018807FA3|nr:hypothetical protein [Tychonema sp. LEGE 07203]MBE9094847.1 hypothetical protein [Tychonema sp. LEGE 07203]
MKRRSLLDKIPNFSNSLELFKTHFFTVPFLAAFNILTVLILGWLSVYAKLNNKGDGVERLFSDPFNFWFPYEGILTGVSEVLGCICVVICAFSFGLLRQKHPRSRSAIFLFFSALLLGVLYVDDRFRMTLILSRLGISKKIIYLCYASGVFLYTYNFWRYIKTTPYLPLVAALFLFAISRLEDIINSPSIGLHAMLEDGTKLLALLNLAFYFWHVCHQEVWRHFQQSEED